MLENQINGLKQAMGGEIVSFANNVSSLERDHNRRLQVLPLSTEGNGMSLIFGSPLTGRAF